MIYSKYMVIAGLGNPGEKYVLTRHNTGRIILEYFLKKLEADNLTYDKKINALKTEVKIGKKIVLLLMPETFMNNSGAALKKLITSKQKARDLIVIHDDLDIPLGNFKIAFNRGSAGHKGVESIIKAIKTEEFIRIRVGVSGKLKSGKIKKPNQEKLLNFIIAKFKPEELKTLKKTSAKIAEALELIINECLEKAMNKFN